MIYTPHAAVVVAWGLTPELTRAAVLARHIRGYSEAASGLSELLDRDLWRTK